MQLDDVLLGEITAAGTRQLVTSGAVLVTAGEVDDQVHVVLSGEFEVRIVSHGAESVVGRMGRGALIGEVSVIAGGPRTATVIAATNAEVATLRAEEFGRWLDDHTEVAAGVVTEARRRFDQVHAVQTLAALVGPEDAAVASALSSRIEIVRFEAGSTLFRRGDHEDDAFLIVAGRVQLDDGNGDRRTVGRHQFLGIDSLFDPVPRAVTATALRETTVARLTRAALAEVAVSEPRVMLLMARSAVATGRSAATPMRPVNIAVVVTAPVDPTPILDVMSAEIAAHGRVIVLSSESVDRQLGRPGIANAAIDSVGLPRLNEYLHELELAHDHVVHVADATITGWTRRTLLHADRVLVVCSPHPDAAEAARIDAARSVLSAVAQQPVWLAVLHPVGTARPRGTAALMDRFGAARVLHARHGDRPGLARWARLATGHGIGLVLSGGGARGFAHVGVQRALAELGIPVDAVGGASIGGPVSLGFAMDVGPDETEQIVARQFRRLMDYTLPVTSLLRGRRIAESIGTSLEGWDIEDFWIPYYCTSTNLTRSQVEVHRRGPAATAVRATVAIPGVLPPVPYQGDLLIDGGVLDNLPVRPMQADTAIGTVIAVDVAPPLGPRATVDYGHSISGWRALWGRLRGRQPSPSIATVLMRTMLVAAILDRNALLAEGLIDLHLDLELKGVGLLEFDRVAPVARAGHDQARPRLEAWLASDAAPARWRRHTEVTA